MSLRDRGTEVRLALMLLTRLPAGRIADPLPSLAAARWAFPLVGLATGLVTWGIHAAARSVGLDDGIAAILAVGAGALVTGGLHLDGLADLADGAGAGRDRTRRLEIMRDSRIGTYGVLALIFAVALQVSALAQLGGSAGLAAFLLAATASRLAMVVLLSALPPARPDGLGRSATGAVRGAWVVGTVLVGLLTVLGGPSALVALALAALAAALLARLALRALGGHTGDVLGAAQVVCETAIWIALAA